MNATRGAPGRAQGRKPIRESQIEKYLVAQVKALGGEYRKVRWIGRCNAPDRFVMLPEKIYPAWQDPNGRPGPGGRLVYWGAEYRVKAKTIWVELKAPGKKPTSGQLREHERMRGMGQRVEVIDSFDGVDKLIGEMK